MKVKSRRGDRYSDFAITQQAKGLEGLKGLPPDAFGADGHLDPDRVLERDPSADGYEGTNNPGAEAPKQG